MALQDVERHIPLRTSSIILERVAPADYRRGTAQQPGIIFLTMQELFERIQERQEDKVTEISLSYLEIYNETIRDLLVPGGSKQGLTLREDANQAVSVSGLSSHHPQNVG
jgi:kinesin family protein 18/19